jgi:hypothetical protein
MAPSPTPSEDTRAEDTFNPDGPLAPAEPMAVNHHKWDIDILSLLLAVLTGFF